MIKIALCDDDLIFLNTLESLINSYFKKNKIDVLIDKFTNGLELISEFKNDMDNYDIVFMDIHLNSENGLDIVNQLRCYDKSFILIFLSSLEDQVFNVFRFNTFRFIRKNFLEKEIISTLDDLKLFIVENSLKYRFKTKYDIINLSVNEIYYFLYFKRTLEVHIENNSFEIPATTFKHIEKEFSKKGFFNINRGILVNLNFVKIIKSDSLVLDNNEVLSVSRYKMPLLKESFFKNGVDI